MMERVKSALVRRLLYPRDAAMLYAESGAGKSFIAADLGWHIALGLDWNGRKVKQAPVIYAALEGVDHTLSRRAL
jgi:RecA-family ATPase